MLYGLKLLWIERAKFLMKLLHEKCYTMLHLGKIVLSEP